MQAHRQMPLYSSNRTCHLQRTVKYYPNNMSLVSASKVWLKDEKSVCTDQWIDVWDDISVCHPQLFIFKRLMPQFVVFLQPSAGSRRTHAINISVTWEHSDMFTLIKIHAHTHVHTSAKIRLVSPDSTVFRLLWKYLRFAHFFMLINKCPYE